MSAAQIPGVELRRIQTQGITLNVAQAGQGPPVLLCHGWPESWYSWRHQLPALAAAGYRAIAPDMRGYGHSDAPEAIDAYSVFHLVGDLVALQDALELRDATIVGHDWGALVAWQAALMRPERFPAVCAMSVPFLPRMPVRPTQMMKAMAGERFMYVLYFQEAGRAEKELEADPENTLRRLLYAASGSVSREDVVWDKPKDSGFLDGMPDPEKLPDWLRAEDLAFYVSEFARTGFRGGLNWYRNFDRNWELGAAWQGAKVRVPALFIGGARDGVVTGPEGDGISLPVQMLEDSVPDLRGKVLIEGAGHWNQQEAPEQTNEALLGFLREVVQGE